MINNYTWVQERLVANSGNYDHLKIGKNTIRKLIINYYNNIVTKQCNKDRFFLSSIMFVVVERKDYQDFEER